MTSEETDSLSGHEIVSRVEWLVARRDLLKREKELARLRDQLSAQRRALPWVKIDKGYVFNAPGGELTLADLFNGRSQLVIYHFMFHPDWQEGCPSCSFVSDHLDGARAHLAARDVTLTMVSRAPLAKIEAFKKRVGWHFKWVSSFGSDFNFDYHVSFAPEQKVGGKVDYNYTIQEFPSDEGSRSERVLQGSDQQRDLPHLLHLRPRARSAGWHVHAARPGTQGARRRRPSVQHAVGPPPRPLRNQLVPR